MLKNSLNNKELNKVTGGNYNINNSETKIKQVLKNKNKSTNIINKIFNDHNISKDNLNDLIKLINDGKIDSVYTKLLNSIKDKSILSQYFY